MYAYCRNNPASRIDISGTEDVDAKKVDLNDGDDVDDDLLGGPKAGGSGTTETPGSYSGPNTPTQPNTTPTNTGSINTGDQNALRQLAEWAIRMAKAGHPISYEDAQLLDQWAAEYGVPQHHPVQIGSGSHWCMNYDHTHIYNLHVPFR